MTLTLHPTPFTHVNGYYYIITSSGGRSTLRHFSSRSIDSATPKVSAAFFLHPRRHLPGSLRLLPGKAFGDEGFLWVDKTHPRPVAGRPALISRRPSGTLFRSKFWNLRPTLPRPGEVLCHRRCQEVFGGASVQFLEWLVPLDPRTAIFRGYFEPRAGAHPFPELQQRLHGRCHRQQRWLGGFLYNAGHFRPAASAPDQWSGPMVALVFLHSSVNLPLLRQLQRWLGGFLEETILTTKQQQPSGYASLRLEEPGELARLVLLAESFAMKPKRRELLAQLSLRALRRPLLPPARHYSPGGSSEADQALLLGRWEAAGNLHLRRDFRGPYPRLGGFALALGGSRENLGGFLRRWGGALHRFPAEEYEPLRH